MKQVETRVTTPRSQEEVYAYLADFDNQAEWRFEDGPVTVSGVWTAS